MPDGPPTVLDDRALNRATLQRQLLLDRTNLPVVDAIAHLGGLQAQEPQEPFVGLWSRLHAFDAASLSDLLTRRLVVRTHLMRRTVHLVTADDVVAWRSRHDAMLRQKVLTTYRKELEAVDLDDLATAGRAVMEDAAPRSASELVGAIGERWADFDGRALGEMLAPGLIPVAQTPPRGLWRAKGGVRNVTLSSWLGRELDPLDDDESDPVGQALVRRYLAAFGPAASADVRAWSGLTGLPRAVAAIRHELVTYRDKRGRELLDLPDSPLPDPDAAAPVRFLPAFDNAVLGYDDRSRVIADEHRGLSVAGARFVLIDGRVGATWTVRDGGVEITPLRRVNRGERREVLDEGHALASFLSDGERDHAVIV